MKPDDAELDGPAAIRAVRASWRRSQIVKAATALMRERGFHETTVNALAKRAGMSVGTVYQYVSSKDDILLLVLLDSLDAYQQQVPAAMAGIEDPIHRLASGFVAYCQAVDEYHSVVTMGYRETGSLSAEGLEQVKQRDAETMGLFLPSVEAAIDAGLLRPGVDAELVAFDLVALGHMWALKRWHLRRELSADRYARLQFGLVVGDALDPSRRVRERYRELLTARPAPRKGAAGAA